VHVAPDKHVLFEFSQKHDSDATAKLLEGTRAISLRMRTSSTTTVYRDGQIIEVGCWSHTRRYFFSALASDPTAQKSRSRT
jgi:transposase